MKAIDSASSRVLSVFSTAPVIGTPKCISTISGVLASIAATVSPGPIPARTSADARRRQRKAVSPQVKRRSPCTTDAWSGHIAAVRSRNESGVSGA